MGLKLMYITNKEDIAKIAEASGVDWIFIDLELRGKKERQGHLDTVISNHRLEDVKKIKQVLTRSKLLVRVNPIYKNSKEEIDRVIDDGCNIVMLPYFKTAEEVKTFIDIIDGRAEVCLLVETTEAVEKIDSILAIGGIDYIHIGLNDLHIGYKKDFMFELLTDGTVEKICNKIKSKGISYGFGGIARIGYGILPAEYVIAEHYRLGSSMAILSRSFCNIDKFVNLDEVKEVFISGIDDIRKLENELKSKSKDYFQMNKKIVFERVQQIVNMLKQN